MGMPGWPEFAACTASIAKARMLFASNELFAAEVVTVGALRRVSGDARCASESGMFMDGRIYKRGMESADAHGGQTALQRAKIIAQPSNLGNNSEFSRIGSAARPGAASHVRSNARINDGRPRGRTQQWTASTCSENGTAARRTARR